jgi:hypothetical protein
MPKALRKLCLISMLALVLPVLPSPRGAEASQPCLINHFGCGSERIDCCCGTRFICAFSSAQCQSFCGG